MKTEGMFILWTLGEHGRIVQLEIPAQLRWEGERGRAVLEIPVQLESVAEGHGGRRQITLRDAAGTALEFVTPDFLPNYVLVLVDTRSSR